MMQVPCTIYKGSRERELYLYVQQGSDLADVPTALLERMGKLKEVMTIDISPRRKLARVEASAVLTAIAENGYFLQLPPKIEGQRMTYGE